MLLRLRIPAAQANDFLRAYESLCGILLELSSGYNPLDMAI